MLMILVDNIGGFYQGWVDHSPWDVVHLADFVMPLFLFMVGVSMAFAMKKYGEGISVRAPWQCPAPGVTGGAAGGGQGGPA
jgi:predicted acyltransferase